MADKGTNKTEAATKRAAEIESELASLGDVSTKAMFGGYGIFESGTMFMMVDAGGEVLYRSSPDTVADFEEAGGQKHSRMPYWTAPNADVSKPEVLLEWATKALEASRTAQKRTKKK
jgi:DNA transformation protein